MASQAFFGPLIHSLSPTDLEICPLALIIVDIDGRITSVAKNVSHAESRKLIASTLIDGISDIQVHDLGPGQFLLPGLVDTHNHAPQWAQRGLGQGLPILDWLQRLTFANESRFHDPNHARRVYAACVTGTLRQGSTTVAYYGSSHVEATKILADTCHAQGQRALIGKCNMNRGAPPGCCDVSVEDSLRETEDCIAHVRDLSRKSGGSSLLHYVLTPRFAISCTDKLLHGLGEIARRNPDLRVQTHFAEAAQEVAATRQLFPRFATAAGEADLYAHFGLLGSRTILAHCCLASHHDMTRLREFDCGVSHCPIANMTVGGGFMAAPVRAFLDRGIKVGLGTDSGGGFSSSILDAVRQALVASYAREATSGGAEKGLNIPEAFYLATLGGAAVCCMSDEIGNFLPGKAFDALVVNTRGGDGGSMTMVEEGDDLETLFSKFVMTGDDRNIARVYVQGRLVKLGHLDGGIL